VDHGKGVRGVLAGCPRHADRFRDRRNEAGNVPASSVPSFFWHRAKRDGLLMPTAMQRPCQFENSVAPAVLPSVQSDFAYSPAAHCNVLLQLQLTPVTFTHISHLQYLYFALQYK
jgi:hypothetical protein